MDEQLMKQLQQVVMAAMQGDQQAAAQLQTIIQQDPDLKPVIEQIAQQLQGAQSVKNGAKLSYIQRLRGKCPEGYELEYFKAGGKVCSKCMKKAAKAGKKMENGGSVDPEYITAFKAKCGGKVKKHENSNGDKLNVRNSETGKATSETKNGVKKVTDGTYTRYEGKNGTSSEYDSGHRISGNDSLSNRFNKERVQELKTKKKK